MTYSVKVNGFSIFTADRDRALKFLEDQTAEFARYVFDKAYNGGNANDLIQVEVEVRG